MYRINIICRRMSDDRAKEVIKRLNTLKGVVDATVYQQQLISADDEIEPYDVSVIRVIYENKIALARVLILCNAQNYSYKLIDGEWYLF